MAEVEPSVSTEGSCFTMELILASSVVPIESLVVTMVLLSGREHCNTGRGEGEGRKKPSSTLICEGRKSKRNERIRQSHRA